MRQNEFQGVVFDVDGTLITSGYTISDCMLATCSKLIDEGIWLSIASARPPKSVRKLGEVIGSRGPLCALNGSLVVNADGTIGHRDSIPTTTATNVITRFADDSRVNMSAYSGNSWFVLKVDEVIEIEAAVVELEPQLVSDLTTVGPIEKILLLAEPALAAELKDSIAKENPGLTVSRSASSYIEITASGIDKATGVERAAAMAKIPMEKVVACGDGENDINMLRNSGYGIAMGHAHSNLKNVASQVVGSNNDDSLAHALLALFNLA